MIAGTDHADFVAADWPAPASVLAGVTTRGVGSGDYGGFNLATHVGDRHSLVAERRERLRTELGVSAIQWLQQVHGTSVLELSSWRAEPPEADGAYTRSRNLALAVLTADCLPVLLCDEAGTEIAAVHAGWRGLAAGILQRAVARFRQPGERILVWLGPAIGSEHFEVGAEVRAAFQRAPSLALAPAQLAVAFRPSRRTGHYYCDLAVLAKLALRSAGVARVYGGDCCTYADPDQFFSYRREAVCGRTAALIARK